MTSRGDFPFVTVMMPVRDEATFIRRSLESVLAQDYPADRMEVFVVDGRSSDGTREAVRSLQPTHANLELLDNPGRIVATGLNVALRRAKGEILVRVDGHCEIARDYVTRCVEHLMRDEAEGVGGPLETVGEDPWSRAIALAMSSRFGVGGAPFRTTSHQTRYVDTVAFPAYRSDVVNRAGPFDEELVRNQDDEYNYRLRGLGARILLAEDVKARYYSRSNLGSLRRQYFQYGYWKVRVMQKHPRQMRPRQFAPPLFAGSLLFTALVAPFGAPGLRLFALVVGSYVLASIAASLICASRASWTMLPLLPLVFATMHLAYGFGFLKGLFFFAGRWGDRRICVRESSETEAEASAR